MLALQPPLFPPLWIPWFTVLRLWPMISAMSISSEPGLGQPHGETLSALTTLVCWQLDPSSHSAGQVPVPPDSLDRNSTVP